MSAVLLKTNNDGWSKKDFSVDQSQLIPSQEFHIAVSDPIGNNSDANSVEVFIKFNSNSPDAPTSTMALSTVVKVVLEKEFVAGEWVTIAESNFQKLEASDPRSRTVRLKALSRNNADVGQRIALPDGYEYQANGAPGDTLRVCVVGKEYTPGGATALQTVNITGGVELKNE